MIWYSQYLVCVLVGIPNTWAKYKGLGFQYNTQKRALKPIVPHYYFVHFIHNRDSIYSVHILGRWLRRVPVSKAKMTMAAASKIKSVHS